MKSSSLSRFASATFGLAAALMLAGCGPSSLPAASSNSTASAPAAAPAGKKIQLAFIPKGMQHVYWKSVKAGLDQAVKEAQDAGTNVDVAWVGPPNEGDRSGQIAVVENYINSNADGIILCPMDADALVPVAEKATRAKIPLVIVDSAINYDKIESFVATDNKNGGIIAADELAKELGGKGNVMMMRFMPGSASTGYREDGFLEEMKAKYPDIHIISSEEYAGDTSEKALDKGGSLLNANKNVDGIFTPNEPSTNGMLLALRNAKLAGKIKFVGFDGGDLNMEGLDKGEITALVLQDPYNMGYMGVKEMLNVLQGKPVDKRVDTGAVLITKDNLNSDKVQTLLKHTVTK